MYKIIEVTANPFKEGELFDYQSFTRKEQLKEILLNNTAIKIKLDTRLYNIISPSFKIKGGERVTWFSDDIVLGHKDYDIKDKYDISDMIRDYLYTGEIIEVIQ